MSGKNVIPHLTKLTNACTGWPRLRKEIRQSVVLNYDLWGRGARFELQRELTKEVEEKMSSNQRKYFLNEQLKQIKRELGIEKDDKEALITKFKERLAERNPPEEVQKVIDDEIAKLSSLESASSEFNVTRSYLEWLSALPWGGDEAGDAGPRGGAAGAG